jgi:hypothetical protein
MSEAWQTGQVCKGSAQYSEDIEATSEALGPQSSCRDQDFK